MHISRRFLLFAFSVYGAALLAAQDSTAGSGPGGAISGKWHFVFDTEGGDRSFDADFKVDGKNVTGTWGGKPEVKGTFQDGKLELEFPTVSEEAGEGTLKVSGKLAGALTGNWSFQSYSGTFKATRPKA